MYLSDERSINVDIYQDFAPKDRTPQFPKSLIGKNVGSNVEQAFAISVEAIIFNVVTSQQKWPETPRNGKSF
jgi:hypothetical protein